MGFSASKVDVLVCSADSSEGEKGDEEGACKLHGCLIYLILGCESIGFQGKDVSKAY